MNEVANYIYGRNAVAAALIARRVEKVFLALGFSDRGLLTELERQTLPIERKENAWLDRLVGGAHQGIVAVVKPYSFTDFEALVVQADKSEHALIIMLDSIQDPHNLGAIVRNADAFGAHGIIIRKDRQVGLTDTVAKVAAGALEHVAIAQVTNLTATIRELKKRGYWIVATALTGAIDYRSFDYRRKLVIVIGSEGFGVTRLVQQESDAIVTIPMVGKTNSINAAAASAVMLAYIHATRFPR